MPGRTGSNDLPGVADGVDSVLDANDVLVLRCEIRHQLRQVVRDADQRRIIDQHVVAKEAPSADVCDSEQHELFRQHVGGLHTHHMKNLAN